MICVSVMKLWGKFFGTEFPSGKWTNDDDDDENDEDDNDDDD